MNWAILGLLLLAMPAALWAHVPPPEPSKTSLIGDIVTNPVTGGTTVVSGYFYDPAGSPTAGTLSFVNTADGYSFMMKVTGEKIYNNDTPPLGFSILSQDTTAKTAELDADPAGGPTTSFTYQTLTTTLQAQMFSAGSAGTVTPPDTTGGAAGYRDVRTGDGGSNGRNGALFVPPRSGGDGSAGPSFTYNNSTVISTTNQIGIEVGSVGGKGGKGGNSYLSFWSGRDGGDGGAGGDVTVTNGNGVQVATTGNNMYGIYAYSRSGAAGDGGGGYAAPGGGTGGHSSNGGSVSITNQGSIITVGDGAYGIYGLSVSNNGGNGGSQWGLVGESGSGGYGGSGGSVTITNAASGSIYTSGAYAHGILAQSIGGSGGSSGTSGNLLVSLNGSADNGGNGGTAYVTNDGSITTTGAYSFGIFAESIGGGGGAGGGSYGLIALGGSGSNGGSSSTVVVINNASGSIGTSGIFSDGIFAQSVGGSGGSAFASGGLVALGGQGGNAGNGGAVTVQNYGTVSTSGNGARGIVAQSIGGGGGDGAFAVGVVAVGGSGSGGGTSSTVTVTNGGDITTNGIDARGIVAQSVGGGGGNGGMAVSGGMYAGVAVGGSGGSGGAGGIVRLTLQGHDASTASVIATQGDRSTGLFAQSVGGGGGTGGGAVQVTGGAFGAVSVAVGGSGGSGGNGGLVTLSKGTGQSVIQTTGDDSGGAYLQSVGGGGGNGGYAISVAVAAGPVSGSLSVAVGGGGGTAGTGGNVTVGTFASNGSLTTVGFDGSILTGGERSTGFLAQSVGGGGGNGGLAVSAAAGGSLFASVSVAVGVGGKGAGGGAGGEVSVGYQGDITTQKAQSTGLLAQSVGGGGGNGGGSVAASLAVSGSVAVPISVGVGGAAGTGSTGGQVTLATRQGAVHTSGDNSSGIIAQSVGGGGGNGGFSVAGGGALGGDGAVTVDVAIGGTGGGGGAGGTVRADLQSSVNTIGQNSTGVLVQSVGGGGGNGGFTVAAGVAVSGSGSGGVAVGVGGKGGSGGIGGSVTAASTGAIGTQGDRSSGFVAQSIGGGGGNGGFNISVAGAIGNGGAVAVGVGGWGGTGNDAGTVTASTTTAGGISTQGNGSIGILAQSVGGGGGNGGFDIAAAAAGGGTAGSLGVSVGGGGASGGNGSTVDLTVKNNVATVGNNSGGILAQSVGGGGGDGGFSIALTGGANFAGSVSVGGFGSGGGNAGSVTARTNGTVGTQGDESTAIAAQSIGGGGGNGGFSISGSLSLGAAGVALSVGGGGGHGGNSSSVVVESYALAQAGAPILATPTMGTISVETDGDKSHGVLAQSIGGGGGNGGFSIAGALAPSGAGISGSVGGFADGGGRSGSVRLTSSNNILTMGENSNGVLAQSIGGGGGNGGFSVAVSGGQSFAGSLSVGGFGGAAGNADAVTVNSYGTIATKGTESNGILAQSLGGGGGNGGFSVAGAFTLGSAGVGLSVGGFGAGGGTAGDVAVSSYATAVNGAAVLTAPAAGVVTLQTVGDRANGILAQSLGGGGGNGGFSAAGGFATGGAGIAASVGGFGAGGGNAGAVTLRSVQNVVTSGESSNGLAAQSIGGGGGNGGFSIGLSAGSEFSGSLSVGGFALGGGGNGGSVTLNSVGRIGTAGDTSNGILAQSLGGSGGNGGFSLAGSFAMQNAGVSISIGGAGSNGGTGGNVSVASNQGLALSGNTATIQTQGESANGIEAQSIGGGGGNGGFSGSFTATVASNATIGISIGGFGAAGNKSGTVGVTSADNILTVGDGSNGIMAQSIGGGGGNGGFSFAGTLAVQPESGLNLSTSLGGFGGSAGDAAAVTVNSTGLISTQGKHADGIDAQSVGGGGGNGGLSVAATFNACLSCSSSPSIAASVGGFGGSGGAGAAVALTHSGGIVTADDYSAGVRAQSIGGGGGNGGLSVAGTISGKDSKQVSAAVGGFGGAGSNAGIVTVNNTGSITTGTVSTVSRQVAQEGEVYQNFVARTGYESSGIVAQSIGGGGGNGGTAISGGLGLVGNNTSLNVGVTLGGFGGSGGTADAVRVTNNGAITTYGNAANGVFAQSIGGGGGNGGSAISGLITAGNPTSGRAINVAISVGGMGGSGNTAGDVTVNQAGGISTSGAGANGILAQSIGGGGGSGGNANSISLMAGTKCTIGLISKVIKSCQSPEKSSVSVSVAVGGFGGSGNNAGTVTVTNRDSIVTTGLFSSGIIAQSIGGGGGTGGNGIIGSGGLIPDSIPVGPEVAAVPVGTAGITSSLAVTVGGFGGASGDGSTVSVTNNGAVSTAGLLSYGVMAQSIGGGGGDGGKAESGLTGTVAVGGWGGGSGNGGAVTVNNSSGASVATAGGFSSAIFAQSVGGGGGDGGSTGGILSLGGFGGNSGNGGTINVTNGGALDTRGLLSNGVLAQSIGGGGGNGGGVGISAIGVGGWAALSTGSGGDVTVKNLLGGTIVTRGDIANGVLAQSIGGGGGTGGSSTMIAAVTVGGSGGVGGDGGHVTIQNGGSIWTSGASSTGVYAQSIGGSGGAGGGSSISAVSVGGFGGSAGNGGIVDVTNTGTIVTAGQAANAISGQSIGGGGGTAGSQGKLFFVPGLSLLVAVGGNGGGGGTGGAVNVTNSHGLQTSGDSASGIYAQSIGGGGGSGGGATGLVAVGGAGGHTGNGGAVTVTNQGGGTIWTKGIGADGIFAQSIGGGGGDGGGAWSGGSSLSSSVGGNGGGGGAGGAVRVDNFSQIQTDGAASQAIFAQSIGNGGGNGAIAGSFKNADLASAGAVLIGGSGGSGGNGGAVTVNNRTAGSIVTNGANSTAIFAQSVGAGGGNGGFSPSESSSVRSSGLFALGGSGGSAGNGGAVSVVNDGFVQINGANSVGIMAQSVGGGGGTAAAGLGSPMVGIGGSTGAVGNGGDVTVINNGSIVIAGDNSVGIFAQSVGGGGGLVTQGSGASGLTLNNGGSGNGGVVTVQNTSGAIVVTGNNSIALFSQSTGGGGGVVRGGGASGTVAGGESVMGSPDGLMGRPDGLMGSPDDVVKRPDDVIRRPDVLMGSPDTGTATGPTFFGSAGGHGVAKATVINQVGSLVGTGINSYGLVAQSDAPDGAGDITVNILNPSASRTSLIEGGSGLGAGVYIMNGKSNQLNNAGIITDVLGVDGFAIRSSSGNDRVTNTGQVIGSVDLGTGANGFVNSSNAFFLPGSTVNLGTGNLFSNAGVLSPGGVNRVLSTGLTGNMVQTSDGFYLADLDLVNVAADRINVSGTASLAGTLVLNLKDLFTSASLAKPGTKDLAIVSAAGGITGQPLTLDALQTAVVSHSLVYPNSTDIVVREVIDYAPGPLSQNGAAVGNSINAIQLAQTSPGLAPIATAMFFQTDRSAVARTYDLLGGAAASSVQPLSFLAGDEFLSAVGRRTNTRVGRNAEGETGLAGTASSGGARASRWGGWVTGYDGTTSLLGNTDVGSADSSQKGNGIAEGVDYRVFPRLLVGVAGGNGNYNFAAPSLLTSGTTTSQHAALYAALGGGTFYATGAAGFALFDNRIARQAILPSAVVPTQVGGTLGAPPQIISATAENLTGKFSGSAFTAAVEAGYTQRAWVFDLTPFLGLQFGHLRTDRYVETTATGPSVLGLIQASRVAESMPTFAGLQIKGGGALGRNLKLFASTRVAWKREFQLDRSSQSAFIAAPDFTFIVQGPQPRRDMMRATLHVRGELFRKVSFFANVQGDFARNVAADVARSFGLSIVW